MFKPESFSKMTQVEYQDVGAHQYRINDNVDITHPEVRDLAERLSALTAEHAVDKHVLEVGCGAGRYFHAVRNAHELVGIDISNNMLVEAIHPAWEDRITVPVITLLHSDLLHYNPNKTFAVIYSFGVLGEHAPFDDKTAHHAYQLLELGGYIFFTAINPFASPAYFIKQVLKKIFRILRIAQNYRFMNTCAFGLHTKNTLQGILQKNGFVIISIEDIQPSHPHYLILAQKK